MFNSAHHSSRTISILQIYSSTIFQKEFHQVGFAMFHGEHQGCLIALEGSKELHRPWRAASEVKHTCVVFTLTLPDSRKRRRTTCLCSSLAISITAAIITARMAASSEQWCFVWLYRLPVYPAWFCKHTSHTLVSKSIFTTCQWPLVTQ